MVSDGSVQQTVSESNCNRFDSDKRHRRWKKKISQDELSELPLVGRGNSSPFYRALAALAVGEILLLEKADWNKRYHPSRTVRYLEKSTGRKHEVLTIATGQGWTVKRIGQLDRMASTGLSRDAR